MLQFVREISISIVLQTASSARRGFLFKLAAGFSKEINPLSGMSVNLVLVDQWLAELKSDLEHTVFESESDSLSHAFAEILAVTRLNLTGNAVEEDAELISLDFREERGWGFAWNHLQSPVEMLVKHSHYLEGFLAVPEDASLCKVEFVWLRTQDCETDFAHEGFKILKNLAAKNFEELQSKLALHQGGELDSDSFLAEIHIHNLSKGYSLTL
ncbi:hypothetical protein B9G69_011325 [Bdellovibrio sp. SKB1291214]|uniref:hypothetical protein n=1 Tax=Bdellovibrio sp. SKB1291214 TaxID=1732569 RepID=UPI000B51DA3C|nr:hypothetical protein [Bdellovibrio sp. SKB1291214]UYL07637.1 hypothetical protein B9G69_011325 [Bdellovibrio sp. SKB1291214]